MITMALLRALAVRPARLDDVPEQDLRIPRPVDGLAIEVRPPV